uniref:PCZA361.12 n=1 Tax=Amycolatopsis orientalis TaxID=31958 RepID=O52813_AMYOR|nr:PCZA361.12 [Amycolatopsis orientalis]
MLRHVDESSATIWVETGGPCTVTIAGCSAETFQVSGHHYALVVVTGFSPGAPYEVHLDGAQVWPQAGSTLPPSRIPVISSDDFTMVFGSCRMPESDDPELGTDALAAYARRMAGQDPADWPASLVLLGDQIYADETSKATTQWITERRGTSEPVGVADFEEYVYLYREAWSTPEVRWLLSTVPTSMILDDHEVIDDWNTSPAWRAHMAEKPWWAERETSALMSYWVYQHLGNLHPDELATDPTYGKVRAAEDAAEVLREFAQSAAGESDGRRATRWSYRRDFGRVRLLMIDTRAGRILSSGKRSIVSDDEFEWIEANAEGSYDHLLIGSSLPWLMPHAISAMQTANEAESARPGLRGRIAEKIRRAVDQEHWPAFKASFDRLTRLIQRSASGSAATVCVLSGDVHHLYAAEASFGTPVNAKVYQLVCSPMHNRIPRIFHPLFRIGWSRALAVVLGKRSLRPPVKWRKIAGPYMTNALATLRISGRKAVVELEKADANGLSPITAIPLG